MLLPPEHSNNNIQGPQKSTYYLSDQQFPTLPAVLKLYSRVQRPGNENLPAHEMLGLRRAEFRGVCSINNAYITYLECFNNSCADAAFGYAEPSDLQRQLQKTSYKVLAELVLLDQPKNEWAASVFSSQEGGFLAGKAFNFCNNEKLEFLYNRPNSYRHS